jgi:hypothetical protein
VQYKVVLEDNIAVLSAVFLCTVSSPLFYQVVVNKDNSRPFTRVGKDGFLRKGFYFLKNSLL